MFVQSFLHELIILENDMHYGPRYHMLIKKLYRSI